MQQHCIRKQTNNNVKQPVRNACLFGEHKFDARVRSGALLKVDAKFQGLRQQLGAE